MNAMKTISLFEMLQRASSEEDVKAAYIAALGLTDVQRNLIDIQTKDIWFEAKVAPTSPYAMFTQLLHYVYVAIQKGEAVPPFLGVIDKEKAAIMPTKAVMALFKDKTIRWGKSASQFTQDTLEQVSTYIGTHFVAFKIETHEVEFVSAVKTAIKTGEFVRTHITPDNLRQVFDQWIIMIASELQGVEASDYALLFFADIMHDGDSATHQDLPARLLHDSKKPVFLLNGQTFELASISGYRQFWAIYHRPPDASHRNYLLERRDSLLPIDDRSFKGAYYTPLKVVDKAYDLLVLTLGKNWQENYIIWDMCCGVGNLEVKHSNHRNVFMSTLDQADIDVMRAAKTCSAATRFQYDYLNDDIDSFGEIDYTLTNKVPLALQQAIADANNKVKGAKKILVLMNPPYAEAGSSQGAKAKNDVSRTWVGNTTMSQYGKASNELFTQFVARIHREMPRACLAMFSTLKYINAPNFEQFRRVWKAKYLGGFAVHSKAFDGLKGNFPIAFLIWDTSKHFVLGNIEIQILNKDAKPIGEKTIVCQAASTYLNVWLKRPRANEYEVIPLKNTVSPYTSVKYFNKWSDNALAYMWCQNNDLQHAGQQTALFSSVWGDSHGFYVNEQNLWQAAVVFAVRQLIAHTWLNHNDQFLQANQPLSQVFKNDCLVYLLFNGKNLTASADNLVWHDDNWSIVNHFIPFTETQVGAPERFESSFMSDYLQDKALSKEAKAVLNEGLVLWQAYFASTDERKVRDELKLNRPDVGWYQIRKALEARNAAGAGVATDFTPFKTAYETLSDKLRPMVYELGFLK
jgi:hypothetical protein